MIWKVRGDTNLGGDTNPGEDMNLGEDTHPMQSEIYLIMRYGRLVSKNEVFLGLNVLCTSHFLFFSFNREIIIRLCLN